MEKITWLGQLLYTNINMYQEYHKELDEVEVSEESLQKHDEAFGQINKLQKMKEDPDRILWTRGA